MSHLTTSSALGARPALAREPVLASRRLSAASWLAIAFFTGTLLFGAVALAMGDVFYLRLATEALIFGGLALSVDLLLGRVGLLPLGQALFFGLGAYVSALVLKHFGAASAINLDGGGSSMMVVDGKPQTLPSDTNNAERPDGDAILIFK